MPYSLERWLAGRWIAGPGMEDALEKARQINRGRISVIINYLARTYAGSRMWRRRWRPILFS